MAETNGPPRTDEEDALATGRRVVQTEASGLRALATALDGAFTRAVSALRAAEGRIIVSGMGKSGHVGRKIAATLASTGSPAQFVHPAEASHGDLGMITTRDAALVLSNSGETAELVSLIEHAKRFGVPLVGVAGRAGSTLLRQADVALLLPEAEEACPMRLAPTTSTTMALALGDALAVALMVSRGFSATDFKAFHPGGALGARLVTVDALMHTGSALPLVSPSTPLADVILEMTAKTFGVAGVEGPDGALVGVVTDGDLRRAMRSDAGLSGLAHLTAADIATTSPKTIARDALAAEALGAMNAMKVTALFVVEQRAPVGLIRIHDCLRAGVR